MGKYIKLYENFDEDAFGFEVDDLSGYESDKYKWSGEETLYLNKNGEEISKWLRRNISEAVVYERKQPNDEYISLKVDNALVCFWRPGTNIYGKNTVIFSQQSFRDFRSLFEDTNINKIKSILIWYINYEFVTDLEKIKVSRF